MLLFTALFICGKLGFGGLTDTVRVKETEPVSVTVQDSRSAAPLNDSLIVIRSVRITGNFRTRTRIVMREMAVQVGDTLRVSQLAEKLTWSQRNINNTNLFITADVDACVTNPDFEYKPVIPPGAIQPVDVDVVLKERWYLFAFPVFDIADRNFNEWWYERGRDLRRTVYGGYLSHRNLTGNGDRLNIALESGFTRRAAVTYQLPYLDRAQRTGMRFDFSYATNKDVAYRTQADKWVYMRSERTLRERFNAGFTLTYRNSFYNYNGFEVRYVRNWIADTVAHLNPGYYLDGNNHQRYLSLSYTYRYDKRDNVAYPLRGKVFQVSIGQAGLFSGARWGVTSLNADYSRFLPVKGPLYYGVGLQGQLTLGKRQPYSALRGIGIGPNVMRGYELYVIDGQNMGLMRNSMRYQLFNVRKQLSWVPVRQFNTLPLAAYLTLFGDLGYIHSNVAAQYESRLANKLLYSTGLGLDVVTFYNVVGRFSYSINRQGQTGIFFNVTRSL